MSNSDDKGAELQSVEKQRKLDSGGCIDYRKYIFCRLLYIDDGLEVRGLTLPLLLIMAHTVAAESFSFVSIFLPSQLENRLDCVKCFLLSNLVTMVLFNEFANRHILARLHVFLEESMNTFRTGLPSETAILKEARDQASSSLKMYIIIFSANCASMVIVLPLGEWLMGRSWKRLPVPWSFPPSDTDLKFLLVFFFQLIGSAVANCLGMVFMSFSSITIQLTALFDVLLLSLNHIEERAAVRSKLEAINYSQSLYNCLRDDVIFYQQLVRELESITPHLRNIFLAFSATVPMIMACEAYPIILGNVTIANLVKSFVFLSIQFVCWAQTCMKLETMADQHVAVFQAMYNTPWYEAGPQYKKLVLTTLTFSTPARYIKARLSNEITATTATFYSFVVSSFNLLNLIRNMN